MVAAQPAPLPNAVPEPSFELVRPRKSRGALWLLLGAVVAIGGFAARPWLAQQVAAAIGTMPDNAGANVDAPPPTAGAAPAASVVNEAPSAADGSARLVVGIASTPAAPSIQAAPRSRGGAREEHVVIHDRLEPEVSEPATPTPAPRAPEPTAAPAPVTPPTPPPASPPPAPKPKSVPVSDADRYGI